MLCTYLHISRGWDISAQSTLDSSLSRQSCPPVQSHSVHQQHIRGCIAFGAAVERRFTCLYSLMLAMRSKATCTCCSWSSHPCGGTPCFSLVLMLDVGAVTHNAKHFTPNANLLGIESSLGIRVAERCSAPEVGGRFTATWHSWLSLMKQAVARLRWRNRSCATCTCRPTPHTLPLVACCVQTIECRLTSHETVGPPRHPLTQSNIEHCNAQGDALHLAYIIPAL